MIFIRRDDEVVVLILNKCKMDGRRERVRIFYLDAKEWESKDDDETRK